jgi:hypothetical protein
MSVIIYLHEKSSLPKDGWLQACLMCETKTSRNIFYKNIKELEQQIKVYVHLCPICTRKINIPDLKTKYIMAIENLLNNAPELQL